MQGNYLITTDSWFYAPDGKKYRAVYGEVTVKDDSILNIKTNRNSSNWFLRVGTDINHVIVAGCQIHYATKCHGRPHDGPVEETIYDAEGGCSRINRESEIYFCD